MVEHADSDLSAEQHREEEPATLGVVLTEAREACGLTIEQIASELRVEASIVAALEHDRLETLAAPVFVKGYVKHLAHRYGLEYEDLLARYSRQTDMDEAPVPVAYTEPIRTGGVFYLPWLIGGLILVLGIPAFWFTWVSRDSLSSLLSPEQEQPVPLPTELETTPFEGDEPSEPGAAAAPAAPPDALEPDALEPDALEPDALEPGDLEPDAAEPLSPVVEPAESTAAPLPDIVEPGDAPPPANAPPTEAEPGDSPIAQDALPVPSAIAAAAAAGDR